MKPGFLSGRYRSEIPESRLRIDRFILRLLDSHRAELRVSARPADLIEDFETLGLAGLDPSLPLTVEGGTVLYTPSALVIDDDVPLSWTAVIEIDELPPRTRKVLLRAARLRDGEELDLHAPDEVERLLMELRGTTWTPEPFAIALH